jgi:hypothetical protein
MAGVRCGWRFSDPSRRNVRTGQQKLALRIVK